VVVHKNRVGKDNGSEQVVSVRVERVNNGIEARDFSGVAYRHLRKTKKIDVEKVAAAQFFLRMSNARIKSTREAGSA
jgi:hypothetical protein